MVRFKPGSNVGDIQQFGTGITASEMWSYLRGAPLSTDGREMRRDSKEVAAWRAAPRKTVRRASRNIAVDVAVRLQALPGSPTDEDMNRYARRLRLQALQACFSACLRPIKAVLKTRLPSLGCRIWGLQEKAAGLHPPGSD